MNVSTTEAATGCWAYSTPANPHGEVRTAWHAKELVQSI
jgi:hypothetical protein